MKTYIGYSCDEHIRYKATSGGVGSAIVKYLLENKIVDYALSFDYDKEHICYIPKLVTCFNDYTICGSIYQEINLAVKIKELIENLKENSTIVFFSLPCQTRNLQNIIEKAGMNSISIGLTCSSQQSREATTYLLSRIGISENDVEYLQYRGNGWPSGIQIKTKDGKEHFIKNNGSIWTQIFHSRLFIQPRCFSCQNTLNDFADIVLADPWLAELARDEKIGKTLFAARTEKGRKCVEACIQKGYIAADTLDDAILPLSQANTIKRKQSYNERPRLRNRMRKIFLSNTYRRWAKHPILFNIHCWIKKQIENIITRKKNNNN